MPDAVDILALERRAAAIRRHIVSIAAAQFAHLGGSMSCADVMAALFFHFLRLEDGARKRDRFLMSKGHAVHAYHSCMVELGKIDAAELPNTGRSGSRLGGHPTRKAPGVEFATGSLGHALSVGVGIAIAEALNQSGSRTVVLLGDGELQEGTVWEAALSAPRFPTEHLVAIVDYNRFQAGGSVDRVMPLEPLADKWRAFRWNVTEINGHDMRAIVTALAAVPARSGPTAIVAHTVKGKGVPGVEGTPRAHYTMLSDDEVARTLEALQ
ncbi:MAG TPA: transketolase [Candidatus Kryptonia bacterium]|nr:transketolase [Candidatus Kryptonia bacterium]